MLVVTCLLVMTLLLPNSIAIAQYDPPGDPPQDPEWEPVAPGIEFRQYILPDPNNVFVARMDRSELDVTIESSIAQGRLSGGLETVRSMVLRYDQALNSWPPIDELAPEQLQLPLPSWGNRNNVVVAINGSYLDLPDSPRRGQVHSGWYAKRFDNLQSGSGFVWKLDRSAFIGECIVHPYPPNHDPDHDRKQIVTFLNTGANQLFHGINVPRGADDLIIYTPQYDTNTKSGGSGIEVLVELNESFLIDPEPSMIKGVVRGIYDGEGSTAIPFDYVVLSASGTAREELLNNQIGVGDEIGISQEIRHYHEDCETPLPVYDWTRSYASVGGSYYFLKDEVIRGFFDKPGATARHPRTAVAYDEDFIFFIVVDGRNPGYSRGMTIFELGKFVRDVLGATHGIAQDGGGSSTMVIDGQVVNNTFCNNVFCKGHLYLPMLQNSINTLDQLVESELQFSGDRGVISVWEPSTNQTSQIVYELATIQRWVPNGLMMVVVEPMEKIERFAPGDEIVTILSANLRLGPGINYGYITTIPGSVTGTIVEHTNQLNGVYAKGFYWWKVRFTFDGEERIGWMADFLLADPNELETQLNYLFESVLR